MTRHLVISDIKLQQIVKLLRRQKFININEVQMNTGI